MGKETEKNEVSFAFESLLEDLDAVIEKLREIGAQAFKEGNYKEAKRNSAIADNLQAFRKKVEKWMSLFSKRSIGSKRGKKKLARGKRTPINDFRIPILEVLLELEGKAKAEEVLKRVEEKMKDMLNEYDYERLPADGTIRWQKTAQWCRYILVKEGLLKSDSSRGIWEISEKGIEYLKKQRGERG